MLDRGLHSEVVEAWLERASANASVAVLLDRFEAALSALWIRTSTTLGEATLIAITERVLYVAVTRHPLLTTLKVNAATGVEFGELRERADEFDLSELRAAIHFVLVEFLTVLGNLTAEVLTDELHAELSRAALPRSRKGKKSAPRRGPRKPPKRTRSDDET